MEKPYEKTYKYISHIRSNVELLFYAYTTNALVEQPRAVTVHFSNSSKWQLFK